MHLKGVQHLHSCCVSHEKITTHFTPFKWRFVIRFFHTIAYVLSRVAAGWGGSHIMPPRMQLTTSDTEHSTGFNFRFPLLARVGQMNVVVSGMCYVRYSFLFRDYY